jgi:hypothetical protein
MPLAAGRRAIQVLWGAAGTELVLLRGAPQAIDDARLGAAGAFQPDKVEHSRMNGLRYCRACNGTGKITSGLWQDVDGLRMFVDRRVKLCERCSGSGFLSGPESAEELAEQRERNRVRQAEYRAWKRDGKE